MIPYKPITPSRGCLVQINGGGWRAFSTNAKAALHVAKSLINGRSAQVSFHRPDDRTNEQFAFTKEVENLMRDFGDGRFLTAIDGQAATTSYSAGSFLV
jgi:hypothetical protein